MVEAAKGMNEFSASKADIAEIELENSTKSANPGDNIDPMVGPEKKELKPRHDFIYNMLNLLGFGKRTDKNRLPGE